MADRLKTEKLIRSVLQSTKDSISLKQFHRDYKKVTDDEIPYQKYGFSTLDSYLKTIPHVVRLCYGPGGAPIMLEAIPDATTQHIADMVSAQKSKRKKDRKKKAENRAARKSSFLLYYDESGVLLPTPTLEMLLPMPVNHWDTTPVGQIKLENSEPPLPPPPPRNNSDSENSDHSRHRITVQHKEQIMRALLPSPAVNYQPKAASEALWLRYAQPVKPTTFPTPVEPLLPTPVQFPIQKPANESTKPPGGIIATVKMDGRSFSSYPEENLSTDTAQEVAAKKAIEELGFASAKEGLLLWCQRKTTSYKSVNVQNFHLSFKDGLAFCALIHRHRPDLIDYSRLTKGNPLENLNTAFDVAEKYLDIPRTLDSEDMCNTAMPDESAVRTYISSYYHAFAGSQKAEIVANRICTILNVDQENERLMEEYKRLASELLEWIRRTTTRLEDRTVVNFMAALQKKLEEFHSYRLEEKPPRLEQKAKLETNLKTLQTKWRLSNVPDYLVSDIANAWTALELEEENFIKHLAQKFKHTADIHEEWTSGKEEMLQSQDFSRCRRLNELNVLKKKHEAFESDLVAHQDLAEQIVAIAQELNALEYHDSASVKARSQRICDQWVRLVPLSQKRWTALNEAERHLERNDQLHLEFAKRATVRRINQFHLEFAKRAALFNGWLNGALKDLVDIFSVRMEEIQGLIDAHEQFKQTLTEAAEEYVSIVMLVQDVQKIAKRYNFSGGALQNSYTFNDINSKWAEVRQLVPKRDQVLQNELIRQKNNEHLRRQFDEEANVVGPWIERQMDALTAIEMDMRRALADQLTKLKTFHQAVDTYRPHMAALEKYHQELQESMVFENNYTPQYNMENLRVGWKHLLTVINRNINEVENQIFTRDSLITMTTTRPFFF